MRIYRVVVSKGGKTDTYTVGAHLEAQEYARDFRAAGYTVEVWARDLRTDAPYQKTAIQQGAVDTKSFEDVVENIWRASPCGEPALSHPQFHCSSCGYGCDDYYSDDECQMPGNRFQFCPCCGKAVTDEAMNIVIERLRELKKWTT